MRKIAIYSLTFIFAMAVSIGLEFLFFALLSKILDATITPRGLGFIVLPFIASAYFANMAIKNDNYYNEQKNNNKDFNIKILPYSKKSFRVRIVITFFWIIIALLVSLINMRGRWLFDGEMYAFIIFGIFPNLLYWSVYWIKSADSK